MDTRALKSWFDNFENNKYLIEQNLFESSLKQVGSESNQAKVVSELYLAKTIQQSVDKIIASNKELQQSNDEHNKKIRFLTWALVGVGIIQAITVGVQIIP